MAGHSHWKQIKEHKGAADAKKSRVFSKLLRAISIAARDEQNPDFNPRLRTAVEKAKEEGVSQDVIERAIKKASSKEGGSLEEFTAEAYSEGGGALIIEALTDNTNRTANELKMVLKDYNARWAEPGSVRWAFEPTNDGGIRGWRSKFTHTLNTQEQQGLRKLIETLENHNDVHAVYTNVLL